jgi:hypothetical protein
VPDDERRRRHAASQGVTYGWGTIPVRARIGATECRTALFPDGRYVVPLAVAVRRSERVDDGR